LVIDRPGAKTPGAIDIGALNISATEIRTQEADQVPEAVAAYIKENNLYGR
jgi:nicotinic acid mononucleotide adenylyltransferase